MSETPVAIPSWSAAPVRGVLTAPANPKIYHITHIDNLPGLVDGALWSDAERLRREVPCTLVGMSEIKRRRIEELDVECHAGTRVGEYVPFYFCPRSIMLYLLHRGNSLGLTYSGGQEPIVHLRADLRAVVDWADAGGRRYAFTKGNAGARYTEFFHEISRIGELNWEAIAAADWRDPSIKEGKQAEFLIERAVPWELVELVGVISERHAEQVTAAIRRAAYQPKVEVMPAWYY